MSLLHKLEWRYAVKKFDSTKEVPEEEVTELLKAMNLTASSYGLQPYEFIVVKDTELQEQLKDASYGQSQITDASHVVVIAAKTSITDADVDAYLEQIAEDRKQPIEELKGYGDMMKGSIGSRPPEEQLTWSQKQCYIALGTLLLAAADLKIDACPMEGFEPDRYDELLDLKEKGLRATVIAPIGYRSVDDDYQHAAKSRRDLDDIVELRYK